MSTTGTTKSTVRRSLCSALLPLALAGAVAIPTFAGEREASASGLSSLASGIAKTFVENAISCAISGSKNLGTCLLTGSSSSSSGLTENDIASIGTAVKDEIIAFNAGSYASQAQTLVTSARSYQRGTSVAGLKQSEADVTNILTSADTLLGQCANSQLGLSGAATYHIVASIKVAFKKEFYEVRKAETVAGLAAPTAGYNVYSQEELDSYLDALSIQTYEVLTNLRSFSSMVDAKFSTLWIDGSVENDSDSSYYYHYWTKKYCFDEPYGTNEAQSTKCAATTWKVHTKKSVWSTGSYSVYFDNSGTYAGISQMEATFSRTNDMIAYRKAKIGDGLLETLARYEKIVAGDHEYCGDGVCSVTDISSCATDCVADAGGARYAQTSSFTRSTSSPQRVLETSAARLEWQSDGNLVLYSKVDGVPLWASSTGGSGYLLDFQAGGNLVVYPAGTTTNFIWQSSTSAANNGKLALVGKVLHVINAAGKSVWNSDEDSHAYATLESQFCYDSSSNRTLLSNGFGDRLDWQTDGNLVVYTSNNVPQWASNTGGSGKYLCNQEDGTLVVYSQSGSILWSQTSFADDARYVKLGMNHLQMTSLLGSLEWTSANTCQSGNLWACDYPRRTIQIKHSGQNVDVGGALQTDGAAYLQWPANGAMNQQFKIVPDGAGYNFVKAAHSDKCMALDPNNTQAGASILQETCSGVDGQRWQVIDVGGGYVSFKSKLTSMCLDIPGASAQQGTILIQWQCSGADNQKFAINTAP